MSVLPMLLLQLPLRGQRTAETEVCVRDGAGLPIAGADVEAGPGTIRQTDASGCVGVPVGGSPASRVTVRVTRPGFAAVVRQITGTPGAVETVVLRPAPVDEQVVDVDARAPTEGDPGATDRLLLTRRRLEEAPGVTLDDRLREVAGFQIFRRTSSLVANPTTQGTSLRGLGSTAASRTLVLSDQVPLLDPFGGWVHWDEIPQLAIQRIELTRGGASNLYGSSAIGGVIDVIPVTPQSTGYALDLAGGSQATSSLNGLGMLAAGPWHGLAASSIVHSVGYILVAPAARGLVDTASNVHSESGRAELRRDLGSTANVFLRGNLLNEARGNGTPDQRNATRLWRYATGGDWSPDGSNRLLLRAFGSREGYRQSFSSVGAGRNSELLTRLQRVPSDQFGGSVQWARSGGPWTSVAGADLQDTRATDVEAPVRGGVALLATAVSARQRQTGGYGELLGQTRPLDPAGRGLSGLRDWRGGWSAALSGRVDRFRSFDARRSGGAGAAVLPEIAETVFDPRLGVTRQLFPAVSVDASVFRAFRGPTLNELYRTGQVGQQITESNPRLRSERATGWELGTVIRPGVPGSVRVSYFWTEINRPVAAVTVSSTPTTLLQMRQNLGQLRSRGVSVEWQLRPWEWMSLTGGYQLAVSTITRFPVDPTLVGRWTAQVPRNVAATQARLTHPRWGTLLLEARLSGRQYDDSANLYQLHSYAEFNAYASRRLWGPIEIYGSAENLLDRQIEAGRTPVLTLASPRTVLAGVRLRSRSP